MTLKGSKYLSGHHTARRVFEIGPSPEEELLRLLSGEKPEPSYKEKSFPFTIGHRGGGQGFAPKADEKLSFERAVNALVAELPAVARR